MSDKTTVRPLPPASYRWIVLAFVSLSMMANYYVFDALNPVGPFLEEQLGFTQAQIGLLDSAYNIAALLVLLAGGIIIDRAGTKRAMVGFGVVTALGGLLIAWSPGGHSGMLAGRFVLGLGAEPLIVAITTVLAKWFKGKELAFAMGLNLTLGRLGSVAADNSRNFAGGLFTGWQPPLVFAAVIGGICIVAGVIYAVLERNAEQRYALGRAGESDKLVLADLLKFGRAYWWSVGLCVTFYSAVFPFRRFANIFFTDARGVSPETAAWLNGLLPLTAMVATPLFGLLADRIGKRALLMAIGSVLFMPTFWLLAHTTLPIYIPVAMLGVAFSLVPAVMWPNVAYIVEEQRLGTGLALMTLCQQIGWASMAWGLGHLNDAAGASAANPAGYQPGMWLLSGLSVLGLFFAAMLWRHERAAARAAAA
jgi:MFS family permease